MKPLIIILILVLMQGCTTVSYEAKRDGDVVEKYTMTTWFKAVEDLSVIRTPNIFGLQIGSTSTDSNAIEAVAKIIEFYANPINTNGE